MHQLKSKIWLGDSDVFAKNPYISQMAAQQILSHPAFVSKEDKLKFDGIEVNKGGYHEEST